MFRYPLSGRPTAFFRGDWTQARVDIERAVAGCRQVDTSHMAAYPLSELGWLCLAEGRWDDASRYMEEASAVAAPSGDLQALRCQVALDRGPCEAELSEIEPVAGMRLPRRWAVEHDGIATTFRLVAAEWLP